MPRETKLADTGSVEERLSRHVENIKRNYASMVRGNPRFADRLQADENQRSCEQTTNRFSYFLNKEKSEGNVLALDTLLAFRVAEAQEHIVKGHRDKAVEKCYSAVSVLLRSIDVLNGEQRLGQPDETGEGEPGKKGSGDHRKKGGRRGWKKEG